MILREWEEDMRHDRDLNPAPFNALDPAIRQELENRGAGGSGGMSFGRVCFVVERVIIRWTWQHVYIAHHVSSSEEEKAPPGHYKEHTSRSILDIRGLALLRNQDAQPMDVSVFATRHWAA
jgi:hypothetical protein